MNTADFEARIAATLSTKCAVADDCALLVAMSGGADSTALLMALHRAGRKVVAAHVNYHLRGDESDGDEQYVAALCRRHDIPCRTLQAHVAESRQRGESTEMTCRRLRYDWFDRLRADTGISYVAVAHHLEDDVETMLGNLLRTTGLSGARGMHWHREPGIVRPMLAVRRDEIEAYLSALGLGWCTDSTNTSDDYRRNLLRNKVIPAIESHIPEASERLAASAMLLKENSALYDYLVAQLRGHFEDEGGSIDVGRLKEHPFGELLLWEWLKGEGISRPMAHDIMDSPTRKGVMFGQFELFDGRLAKTGDEMGVIFTKKGKITTNELFSVEIITEMPDFCSKKPTAATAFFDSSILDGEPEWQLRPWLPGDRCRPFGMKGTKPVADILTECGISAAKKKCVPLLTRNGEVVWIPGLKNMDLFRVTAASQAVVRLSLCSDTAPCRR